MNWNILTLERRNTLPGNGETKWGGTGGRGDGAKQEERRVRDCRGRKHRERKGDCSDIS